jgi:hypothetical protein
MDTLPQDCLDVICYWLCDSLFAFAPTYPARYPNEFADGLVLHARIRRAELHAAPHAAPQPKRSHRKPRTFSDILVQEAYRQYHWKERDFYCHTWTDAKRVQATRELRTAFIPLLRFSSTCRRLQTQVKWQIVFDALAGDFASRTLRTENNETGIFPSNSWIEDDAFLTPTYMRLVVLFPLGLDRRHEVREELVTRMRKELQKSRRAEMDAKGPRRSERVSKRARHD